MLPPPCRRLPPAAAGRLHRAHCRPGAALYSHQRTLSLANTQAKQAAEAAARAAAKAAKGDAAAALEDDSNEETDPTKSVCLQCICS